MCSPTSGGLEFPDDCTDEEILLFLVGRRHGDAVPLNVITEVNPYSTEPWDLPEDIWYLYNAEDTQSYRGNFIMTDIGYWRPVNDLKVVTSTSSVGRKTTWDFFLGKEPFGYRTGWVMHDYRGEEKPHPGMKRDYTSLCKVFFQNEQQTNTGEQDTPVTAGVDDKTIDSKLLRSLEQEEPNALENHANRFQVSVGDGHSRSSLFEKNSQDLASYKPVEDTATNNFSEEGYLELKKACNMEASYSSPANSAAYDFSQRDYLELNDLDSSNTSSSSSDNSSYMSGNLDEYFDSDALLRDIGYESDLNVDEEHANCKFSVSASVKPDNVVINPPPKGFVHCNNSDVDVVVEPLPVDPLPEEGQDLVPDVSVSAAEIVHTGNASPSGTPEEIRTNQSPFSQDMSPPRGGSRSSGRMAKLRKKYLCFGSF